MPGVNLPLSQVGYYLATLLICAVIHEAGHAIAAARYLLSFISFIQQVTYSHVIYRFYPVDLF